MAQSSQSVEPPQKPGRFTNKNQTTFELSALQNLHAAGHIETDALVPKTNARRFTDLGPGELERAAERMRALQNPAASSYSLSQIGKFQRKTAHCTSPLDVLLELADRQSERGNFTARHSKHSVALLEEAIQKHYNKPEKPTRISAFREYQKACEAKALEIGESVTPISYSRFCRSCNEYEDIAKRGGKRRRYQKAPITQYLDNAYPVHGVRPHEVVHVDHTVATMALISPNGTSLGKPYLTIATDATVKKCRALIYSFNPPSAATVLLVLRDYVRRNGRLPAALVLDNGKEFHSKELAFFCQLFGIELRYRSPGMPRSGSPVERAFGMVETELFAQLEGNTRQMRDPRLTTDEVNPFKRASSTLTSLHYATEKLLFEDKPNEVSPALGMTPNEFEEKLFKDTGLREHVLVRYDENLILLTCPHAKKRLHTVDPRRGVWVDGMWYMHEKFKKLLGKTKAEVRVEPWQHRVVYVLLNDRWLAATAGNVHWLGNRTRREVEVALREERRKSGVDAKRDSLGLRKAKAAVSVKEPSFFDPRLRCQQQEQLYLYGQTGMVGMTLAMPDVTDPVTIVVDAKVIDSPGSAPIYLAAPPAPPTQPHSDTLSVTSHRNEESDEFFLPSNFIQG